MSLPTICYRLLTMAGSYTVHTVKLHFQENSISNLNIKFKKQLVSRIKYSLFSLIDKTKMKVIVIFKY